MNKRKKKKYASKYYYKRYDNPKLSPKTINELFKLTYRDPYDRLIYHKNPIMKFIKPSSYWIAPVILGLENGISFSLDKIAE